MKSKPITSKSKGSPLHVEGELLGKKTVVDAKGNRLQADDAGESTPAEPAVTETTVKPYSKKWDKEKAGGLSYAEWIKVPGNKAKEKKFVESRTETKVVKPATDGSFNRTTEYKPELTEERKADQVDVFLPWERRFAQRTQRGAVRDEKRRGRKGMKDLDKALAAGAISQEDYDRDYKQAQKLALGQGNIAKGQYTNTGRMDAILSQGYQANPAVRTTTDMMRDPKAAVAAGQPVKADGTEDMTKAEYEAGGKSTPKTSASVQNASKKAGASVKIDEAKVAAAEANEGQSLDIQDIPKASSDLPKVVDANEQTVSVPSKSYRGDGSTKPLGSNDIIKVDAVKPKSSDMFGGLSSTDLGILSEALTDQANYKTNAANEFLGESVIANTGTGSRNDMRSFEPTARDRAQKEVNAQEEASKAVQNELERVSPMSKKGYKMNRSHRPDMMYKRSDSPSPTKMKDLSGDGKVTRKDVLIGRGVLNKDGSPAQKKSSAFKMKGFGSKYKK